jgi:hypothetical protein
MSVASRNPSKPELITQFIAQLLPLIPPIICKASKVLRRSLLTVGAVLIGGTLVPSIHAASMDPVAFINALGNQLQVVARNGSPEQTLSRLRKKSVGRSFAADQGMRHVCNPLI